MSAQERARRGGDIVPSLHRSLPRARPVPWAAVPRPSVLLAAVAALFLGGWVAATILLLFLPAEAVPPHADAVVVLSGSKRRLDRGLELVQGGVAPVLVVSAGFDPRQPRARRLCLAGRGRGFRVLCFWPRPDSTRGEARGVERLARRYGWRSIVLVTSRFHVTRARMLFRRCLDARVDAVGVSYPWTSTPMAVVGEWAKLLYALVLARSC